MFSKIFFCLTVFLTSFLSFQKSFCNETLSNSLSLVSMFSLSKIPPYITQGFLCKI